MKAKGPLRVLVVGAGHRALIYGGYQDVDPERMVVTGVVDPDPLRREHAAVVFGLDRDQTWSTIAEAPVVGQVADAAINGTMDRVHVITTVELLEKGYDVLLEKPIATDASDLISLQQTANRTGRTVQVCHVLRHAPFYQKIRELISAGRVGTILNIQMAENVAYDHMAVSYVRGSFSNSMRSGSSMLLAKCCHDLDLMSWLAGSARPVRATSAGSRMYFREENAPAGSGKRCMVDCAIESSCAYSAKRHYVDNGWWPFYAWQSIEDQTFLPTREQMLTSLRGDNPYGRCVWRTDTDLVDHQVVSVEFDNGATGSLSMVGNSALPSRTIHIVGTGGEVFGTMENGIVTLQEIPDTGPERALTSTFAAGESEDMHGGGDLRLVADFVTVLRGGAPTLSTTALEDSIDGHLIGFAAERGRIERRWVDLEEFHTTDVEQTH